MPSDMSFPLIIVFNSLMNGGVSELDPRSAVINELCQYSLSMLSKVAHDASIFLNPLLKCYVGMIHGG